jgi:hypothetical protein
VYVPAANKNAIAKYLMYLLSSLQRIYTSRRTVPTNSNINPMDSMAWTAVNQSVKYKMVHI